MEWGGRGCAGGDEGAGWTLPLSLFEVRHRRTDVFGESVSWRRMPPCVHTTTAAIKREPRRLRPPLTSRIKFKLLHVLGAAPPSMSMTHANDERTSRVTISHSRTNNEYRASEQAAAFRAAFPAASLCSRSLPQPERNETKRTETTFETGRSGRASRAPSCPAKPTTTSSTWTRTAARARGPTGAGGYRGASATGRRSS